MNKKHLIVIAIIAILTISFGLTIPVSESEEDLFTYKGSYIIFKEGNYYIAKNVASDSFDFYDTSLSYVVQSAVDNIKINGGGRIHFLGGLYLFEETIYVDYSYLDVVGDGQGTILNKLNGGTLFYIGNNEETLDNVNFENLQIDGEGTDIGILYNRTRWFSLVNINFNNFNKVGSTALYITTWGRWVSSINIINCLFYAQNGIKAVSERYAINVIKILASNFFRSGTKDGEQIALEFQNANTFAIEGLPNISGYDIGVKLSRSSDSNRISGRFENNDLNIFIGQGCKNNIITDWTSWNGMTKSGSLNIENYGRNTKISRILRGL